MKVLIVDDENLALNRLNRLLNEQNITNITACNDPLLALEKIKEESFDAIFLDISMPKMNGLELAQKIAKYSANTFIVFQTAYEKFALEAYQSGGMGYLLKPIQSKSIGAIVEKIRLFLGNKSQNEPKILAKSHDVIHLVPISEIYFIKANLDEVILQTKEQELYAKKKIGELEQFLKDKNFFRIHRSYLLNVDKIQSMQSVEQSKLQISFKELDCIVTSSKEGAKEFREYLQRRVI
ncbi:MAG: LytTR family DNA-binding domain-containing protein [Arcobacteraceae bacterium]